jgi:hypothetical protein
MRKLWDFLASFSPTSVHADKIGSIPDRAAHLSPPTREQRGFLERKGFKQSSFDCATVAIAALVSEKLTLHLSAPGRRNDSGIAG